MSDGDAVGPRQLNLGIGASGLWDFALAEVGQTQLGITKQGTLFSVRLDAILEITLERLIQRCGCTLVQDSKPVHGLLGGLNDNKRFGHDQLPVF